MNKKIIILCALILCVSCVVSLTACKNGEKEESTTEKLNYVQVAESLENKNDSIVKELDYIVQGNSVIIKGFKKKGNNRIFLNLPDKIDNVKVTEIAEKAFEDCDRLLQVQLGTYVEKIGNYAFSGCGSLVSVKVSSNLKTVGTGAFENCTSLSGIQLKFGVKTIAGNAFKNTGVTSLYIPSTVTKIGKIFGSSPKNIVISGVKGSEAQTWAKANKLEFNIKEETVSVYETVTGETTTEYQLPTEPVSTTSNIIIDSNIVPENEAKDVTAAINGKLVTEKDTTEKGPEEKTTAETTKAETSKADKTAE